MHLLVTYTHLMIHFYRLCSGLFFLLVLSALWGRGMVVMALTGYRTWALVRYTL